MLMCFMIKIENEFSFCLMRQLFLSLHLKNICVCLLLNVISTILQFLMLQLPGVLWLLKFHLHVRSGLTYPQSHSKKFPENSLHLQSNFWRIAIHTDLTMLTYGCG